MKFVIGIEPPKKENEAWGIVVPVFQRYGLGCFSAADEYQDIHNQTVVVISEMLDEVKSSNQVFLENNESIDEYKAAYPDFTYWDTIEHIDTKKTARYIEKL